MASDDHDETIEGSSRIALVESVLVLGATRGHGEAAQSANWDRESIRLGSDD